MLVTAAMVRRQAQKDGISDFVLSAIVGTLLGDGCITRPAQHGNANSRIMWNHGLKQKDYLEYKAGILSGLVTRPVSVCPNPGYGDYWAKLATRSLRTFTLLAWMVYPTTGCRKTVTQELLDLMTDPIGLAWWFGDDGSRLKDRNTGDLATNGFTLEEVNLLRRWLKVRWGVTTRVNHVKHSSTGRYADIIYIDSRGFVVLSNLALQYLPESLSYKLALVTKVCKHCGKTFPVITQTPYCSEECRAVAQKQNKQAYSEQYIRENHDKILQRGAAYREEHRAEIRQKSRAAYAAMTPEQREHKAQYAKDYQQTHKDERNARRRAWRARMKGDPEYERKLKEERKRYYQRKHADPERHQRDLELRRAAAKKPARRQSALEYQRKYRAEHPEIYAAQQQRANAREKERMQNDPEYREMRLAKDREYHAAHRARQKMGTSSTTE